MMQWMQWTKLQTRAFIEVGPTCTILRSCLEVMSPGSQEEVEYHSRDSRDIEMLYFIFGNYPQPVMRILFNGSYLVELAYT